MPFEVVAIRFAFICPTLPSHPLHIYERVSSYAYYFKYSNHANTADELSWWHSQRLGKLVQPKRGHELVGLGN